MSDPIDYPEDQLHMLRHMLGINVTDRANPNEYRDYAACNPGDERMLALEAAGLVRCYRRATEGLDWWTTTDTGKSVARKSHRARLMPKKKRVYRAYLRMLDVDPDTTFKQFITDPAFAEARDV